MTTLQFTLLSALVAAPRHGYALVAEVEAETGKRPGVATVYAAIVKLQAAGYVVAAGDEIVDGRSRRYFALTTAGTTALSVEAEEIYQRAGRARRRIRAASSTTEALA